jgi:hypothetical protein
MAESVFKPPPGGETQKGSTAEHVACPLLNRDHQVVSRSWVRVPETWALFASQRRVAERRAGIDDLTLALTVPGVYRT